MATLTTAEVITWAVGLFGILSFILTYGINRKKTKAEIENLASESLERALRELREDYNRVLLVSESAQREAKEANERVEKLEKVIDRMRRDWDEDARLLSFYKEAVKEGEGCPHFETCPVAKKLNTKI